MFRLLPSAMPSTKPAIVAVASILLLAACSNSTELAIGEERVAPNEAAVEAEMRTLIEEISRTRQAEREDGLMTRFNQSKTVACADAIFTVPDLEPRLAQGLFASSGAHQATLRFANATEADDREKDLRGLSIKVRGVAGARSVSGPDGEQDFLFNSYPALFVGNPDEFLDFVRATADGSRIGFFLRHPKSLLIILRARGNPRSPLDVSYFSTTPFRHGEDSAVKYSVTPCTGLGADEGARDGPDYLRAALEDDLSSGDVCLDFKVQFQTNPDLMPVEDASVTWPERASPFERVARIQIPAQTVSDAAALFACETLTFNPWSTHPAHRPLGGVNRVRKGLYDHIGAFRNKANAAR